MFGYSLRSTKYASSRAMVSKVHSQIQEAFAANAQLVQNFVSVLAQDLCPGIEIFVNPVAEAHQPEGIVLVLGPGDKFRNALLSANLAQHVQNGFR